MTFVVTLKSDIVLLDMLEKEKNPSPLLSCKSSRGPITDSHFLFVYWKFSPVTVNVRWSIDVINLLMANPSVHFVLETEGRTMQTEL